MWEGGVTIILIGVILGVIGWIGEYKKWNDGICSENGLHWERFDMDSQGGRLYKAGDNYCAISWFWID